MFKTAFFLIQKKDIGLLVQQITVLSSNSPGAKEKDTTQKEFETPLKLLKMYYFGAAVAAFLFVTKTFFLSGTTEWPLPAIVSPEKTWLFIFIFMLQIYFLFITCHIISGVDIFYFALVCSMKPNFESLNCTLLNISYDNEKDTLRKLKNFTVVYENLLR